MSEKNLFIKRSWLNPRDSEDTGHVRSTSYLSKWRLINNDGSPDPHSDIRSEFSLADCSRKVDIDLSCSTQKTALQRIAKIDILLSHLHGLRYAIENNLKELK